MTNKALEIAVEKAIAGDQKALEFVVIEIKDLIYNLALKMLLFPADAEDATQEILIKVITHLSAFQQQSQFTTWVYRIATNYLINHQGKKSQAFAMPFEAYENLIDAGHSDQVRHASNAGELRLLEEEVKVSCTQGLLLCLSAIDRMVYILSELLEFNSQEGSQLLDISPENFRKKLSRSRTKIRHFLTAKCGLANPKNPCRCTKKIDYLIDQKVVDPKHLRFAPHSNRSIELVEQIKHLERSVAIFRSTPKFSAPEVVLQKTKETLNLP